MSFPKSDDASLLSEKVLSTHSLRVSGIFSMRSWWQFGYPTILWIVYVLQDCLLPEIVQWGFEIWRGIVEIHCSSWLLFAKGCWAHPSLSLLSGMGRTWRQRLLSLSQKFCLLPAHFVDHGYWFGIITGINWGINLEILFHGFYPADSIFCSPKKSAGKSCLDFGGVSGGGHQIPWGWARIGQRLWWWNSWRGSCGQKEEEWGGLVIDAAGSAVIVRRATRSKGFVIGTLG